MRRLFRCVLVAGLAASLAASLGTAPAAADDAVTISAPVQAADPPVVVITPAEDDADRHAGYYYPAPDSTETYVARARTLAEADRRIRVGFLVGLEEQIAKGGQPIPYALFAKGSEAQKLIMVALVDGPLDTLYRARGVLANLTAQSRLLPVFREHGVEDLFTFFDLLVLLGYEQLTITDGKSWAHQVKLVPPSQERALATITLRVGGMTCGGCIAAVTRALKRLDPTAGVEADLPSGRVTVTSERPAPDLAAAVEQAGFSVEVAS